MFSAFFFFNDPAPTEIYTLSLHDALPISHRRGADVHRRPLHDGPLRRGRGGEADRKSTRLNSSHVEISYAVFCLKKKKKEKTKKKKYQLNEARRSNPDTADIVRVQS